MDNNMHPFRGFLSPGLHFSSGYSMRLYNFTSTPEGIDPFIQIWLLTPNKQAVLYIDPEKAKELVCAWYNFDKVVGGHFSCHWPDARELFLEMNAQNGTTLELKMVLGPSLATNILNATIKFTPRAIMRTGPMLAFSERLFNSMLGLGGVKIAGKTDLGSAYYTEAGQIFILKSASGKLNQEDLGKLIHPQEPKYFRKTRLADRPIFAYGTSYIEVP